MEVVSVPRIHCMSFLHITKAKAADDESGVWGTMKPTYQHAICAEEKILAGAARKLTE